MSKQVNRFTVNLSNDLRTVERDVMRREHGFIGGMLSKRVGRIRRARRRTPELSGVGNWREGIVAQGPHPGCHQGTQRTAGKGPDGRSGARQAARSCEEGSRGMPRPSQRICYLRHVEKPVVCLFGDSILTLMLVDITVESQFGVSCDEL